MLEMGLHSFVVLRATYHNSPHNHDSSLFNLHMPTRMGEEGKPTTMLEMGLHPILVLPSTNHNSRDDLLDVHLPYNIFEIGVCLCHDLPWQQGVHQTLLRLPYYYSNNHNLPDLLDVHLPTNIHKEHVWWQSDMPRAQGVHSKVLCLSNNHHSAHNHPLPHNHALHNHREGRLAMLNSGALQTL
jgi:hypothetical protein